MISRQDHTQKRKSAKEPINGLGDITFPPVTGTNNSFDPNVLSYGDAEERIIINTKYPEQTVAIGKQLPTNIKERLQKLLIGNIDVFAWTYANMTGIPRTIMVGGKSFNMENKLNEYKHIKPIKQKRHGLGSDRKEAACREVEELTKAGILRKDGYPLPEIDWKVESVLGFRLKCFLDTYKGYHQIQMAEEDEDKTIFFAGKEVFCYQKMPFELKNAGATYQRLVDKVFGDQIGRNLEAYVDDMVIKSTSEDDMLQDIQETFDRFRSVSMKLNPKKMLFWCRRRPVFRTFHYKARNKGQLAEGQGSD
ncbi:reverse transcriptase domain-containing protein [Tanacetum coccineum]